MHYKENKELKHLSIAVISDHLNNDTVPVYEYQKIVISYLKTNFTLKTSLIESLKSVTNF